jgi:uncharacterized damage-inducible protein DinB
MSHFEPILAELEQEAAITRRVLERIPSDQLQWRPHEKSMSLGQLSLHVANIPGGIAGMLANDSFQINPEVLASPRAPASKAEVLAALEQGLDQARNFLGGLTEQAAGATFRLMAGPTEILAIPRAAAIRAIMLNHWYHHRGQLSVYLRLLNVPVPAIYGVSADENPFLEAAGAR